ncbi:PEP-CTERM sorting domain-containing protein [Roseateles depolymerans]|uniref:PEP-CTERM sorting domain-containing protein n=1 Tax=Roseateles depolymerans TaxID=76731 RepID=UPI0009F82A60|nr:PEP-CTERM sorting domain-containing protein [Roseateles depolymerans]REG19720.1 putative secreted protein with PEP-CTERM sorting signal [Roseateles depolymerans]
MKRALSAALLGAAVSLSAQGAAVVNGDFESGTLNGWYASGAFVGGSSTAIVNAGNGYPALTGNQSALIVAMSLHDLNENVTCTSDPWNINCPQPAPFSPSGAAAPTFFSQNLAGRFLRGGFIAQDVNVSAGDTLDWLSKRFGEVAVGTAGSAGNVDNAFFIASNGITEAVIDLRSSTSSFTFGQGGLWSIYFGVQQTEDPTLYSALQVDAIALRSTEVPEPASLALVLAGGGALFWQRRRNTGRARVALALDITPSAAHPAA